MPIMTTMPESRGRSRRPPVPKNSPPNRLREQRLARRMTLAELSRRAQINAQTIHRYETGERAVSVERMEVLSKAMGLTLPDVIIYASNTAGMSASLALAGVSGVPAPGLDTLEANVTDRAMELALAIADAAGPQAQPARARLIREVLAFVADVRRRVLQAPEKDRTP